MDSAMTRDEQYTWARLADAELTHDSELARDEVSRLGPSMINKPGYWKVWLRQGHWSLAWAIGFCAIAAVMFREWEWLLFPLVILASDMLRARMTWKRRRARE
jgi:hypothetical protein